MHAKAATSQQGCLSPSDCKIIIFAAMPKNVCRYRSAIFIHIQLIFFRSIFRKNTGICKAVTIKMKGNLMPKYTGKVNINGVLHDVEFVAEHTVQSILSGIKSATGIALNAASIASLWMHRHDGTKEKVDI
jgi:hypothetical protein